MKRSKGEGTSVGIKKAVFRETCIKSVRDTGHCNADSEYGIGSAGIQGMKLKRCLNTATSAANDCGSCEGSPDKRRLRRQAVRQRLGAMG